MPLRSGGWRMNLDECLEELIDIMASLEEKVVKVEWPYDGVISLYSAEELNGLPAETVLCSSQGDFFLRAWDDERPWLSSNKYYSSEELFGLLLEASKNEVRLYATSTDTIVKELQK